MMKIIPQNDIVLCRQMLSSKKETSTGFVYNSNDIPLYRVERIGPNVKMALSEGDIVVVNSTGTKAMLDGIEYCLFKEGNIAGKVEQN